MNAYGASPLNSRHRSTKAQMAEFRTAIWDLARKYKPLTGRQLYYRAVVAGLIGKDEGKSRASEKRIQDAVGYMRERYVDYFYNHDGGYLRHSLGESTRRELLIMPFDWLADNTRTRYQADQYADKDAAIKQMHQFYRRDLWRAQPRHVEVWCESDALADVLMKVTDEYGLALLPCRGQAGKRFVYDSARSYRALGKPVVVLYVGDFDPSGLDIRRSLHERMIRYGAPKVDFRWLAITPEQVHEQHLTGHGLNRNLSAPVLRRFYEACDGWGIPREAVEAEAMEPAALRALLDDEITSLIDQRQWELEQAVEEQERRDLGDLLDESHRVIPLET